MRDDAARLVQQRERDVRRLRVAEIEHADRRVEVAGRAFGEVAHVRPNGCRPAANSCAFVRPSPSGSPVASAASFGSSPKNVSHASGIVSPSVSVSCAAIPARGGARREGSTGPPRVDVRTRATIANRRSDDGRLIDGLAGGRVGRGGGEGRGVPRDPAGVERMGGRASTMYRMRNGLQRGGGVPS